MLSDYAPEPVELDVDLIDEARLAQIRWVYALGFMLATLGLLNLMALIVWIPPSRNSALYWSAGVVFAVLTFLGGVATSLLGRYARRFFADRRDERSRYLDQKAVRSLTVSGHPNEDISVEASGEGRG